MKTHRIIAVALVALSIVLVPGLGPVEQDAASSPTATFKVDATHSTAIFRVHHLGAGQFYGRFNDIQGTITFAEGSASDLAFDITIPIESVDTNNDRLDRHLKSPDFFNAREHPEMSFKSKSARRLDGGTYEVTGDLTIHGTTKTITTKINWTGTADMGGTTRCGFEAMFDVKRSDYGVMYGVDNGALGDMTGIIISLEGIKQ
jgi:polyisoprenoid-binding protein YceI